MDRNRFVFVFVIQAFLFFENRSVLAKRRFKMEPRIILQELGNCPGHNGPNQYANSSLFVAGKGIILANADWVIKEPAEKLSGVLKMTKCTSSVRSDCEHFMKVDFPDMCEVIVKKGQLWSPIYDNIKPRLKCPVAKGIYRQRNASYDVNTVLRYEAMIPFLDNYLWRFSVLMIREPDKMEFFCYGGAGEFKRVRIKS